MTISKSEFLETTRKSRVLSDQQLQAWIGNPETDGVRLANQMVREKALTEWQAKYLLTGRHQLDIGPYRILERTQRDELGDRFSAIHLQLGRNVDLQMLSAALSKDQAQYQSFIERVGQTSKLDHPNLSHVYDVDKTGGRYYLVTEHVDGERFSDLKGSTLRLPTVAQWLSQAISGLRLVHSLNLVHGDLRFEDLMVDREQGIKILNLGITELRMPLDARQNPRNAVDDWRALGKIFQDFNNHVAASHSSADLSEWLALIHELSNLKDVKKIDEIEQRLTVVREHFGSVEAEELGIRLDQIDDLSLENRDESEYATTTPSGRNRTLASASKTESPKTTSRAVPDESDQDTATEDSFFARLALANPVGLLSSAFVIGLMLAGTLTYLVLGVYTDRSVAQTNGYVQNNEPTTKKLVPTSLKQANPQPKTTGSLLDGIDANALVNELESTPVQPEIANPPSAANVPLGFVPDHTVDMQASAPAAKAETQTAQLPTIQSASTTSAQPPLTEPAPTQPVPESVPSGVTPAQPAASQTPTSGSLTPDERQKRLENPFGQMAKQLSLPLTDDLAEVKLGEVFISDRFLLGAELVFSAAIFNQKVHFETVRDSSNNQRWLINVARSTKDKKLPIAAIRRDGQDIYFQWLPEAKTNRQSGWLKNCLLKLFIPDKSVLLPLRTPVLIDPLMLDAEKLTAESVFEIDYLPKAESLLVEVLPVTIDDTRLQPSVIDLAGIPGRVLLKREDDKAAVWVNLGLELKAKSKVKAELVATDGVRLMTLKNLKELQAIAATWKQQELLLTQQVAAAEATPAPRGQGEEKDRYIAELKRQKSHATSYATKFQQYVELAPKMMGHPYGIRIVTRFDGVEVELARTSDSGKP